jgi:hypothetical protein
MANLEVIALDTATPQLKAPQSGDGYAMPRPVAVTGTFDVTGAATATSLALGGATLGANAFAVTGGSLLNGSLTLTDAILTRDAANTLAQRNSTSAQILRVYNTYTDASNYERGKIAWASNVLQIGTEKAGTGTARSLELQTDGTTRLTISTTGQVNLTGGLISANFLSAGSSSYFEFTSRTVFRSPSDGVLKLSNNAETDFGRLQFGGTTSSFPAIKRSTTIVQVRLADDSAYAPLEASTLRAATAYTVATLPAAGTAGRRAYVTDALAPTFLGALTGGGAVVTPVFDNGTAWVAG